VNKSKTPTFLLELPLSIDAGQASCLRDHFEAARCLYNALLGEGLTRMQRMRAGPAWQEARAIPRTQRKERSAAFARLLIASSMSAWFVARHLAHGPKGRTRKATATLCS
jgi:hypothetical protein